MCIATSDTLNHLDLRIIGATQGASDGTVIELAHIALAPLIHMVIEPQAVLPHRILYGPIAFRFFLHKNCTQRSFLLFFHLSSLLSSLMSSMLSLFGVEFDDDPELASILVKECSCENFSFVLLLIAID